MRSGILSKLEKTINVQYVRRNKLYLGKLFYAWLCILPLLLFFIPWTYANSLQFKTSILVDHVEGHGFELEGIKIIFDVQAKNVSSYIVEIQSALLPVQKSRIKDIAFTCNEGLFSQQEISCIDGMLSFKDPVITADSSPINFHIKKNGEYSLRIDSIQLAGGFTSVDMTMQHDKWVANLSTRNVSLAKLQSVHPYLSELSLVGNLQGSLRLDGYRSVIQAIMGNAEVTGLDFSNQESTSVGEDVAAKFSFKAHRIDQLWRSDISSTVFAGELYFDPIFIDANESPKDVYGEIAWEVHTNNIQLVPLHMEDQNAGHMKISTTFNIEEKKPIAPIELNIEYAILPQAYKTYMQPFFLDTNLADLTTSGSLSGSVEIDDVNISDANFDLNRVSFIDKQKRFALLNLDGNIGWGERYIDTDYKMEFESANIYKLRLGKTAFSFSNQGDSLKLNQVANVPVLNGALNIESFIVSNPGKDDQSISLDLSLIPVSMAKLSSVFAWPELSGDLAGYAPNVTYKQGDLDVQGALLVRAFNGTTTIHNLRAHDLFSVTPKLFADIKIQNLNLGSLTETFSFGEITGKLNGYINNLQFVNWQPIQFDAWLGTPENDKSRHRISQKAVDNLTQIGNGASNIFSKSFLRFFDSFGYDRLGIGCRLYNSICEMRGVANRDNGFYIVKGSGVPRIDIIGFTEKVSWPVLIARLKRVISTQDIVVQ